LTAIVDPILVNYGKERRRNKTAMSMSILQFGFHYFKAFGI